MLSFFGNKNTVSTASEQIRPIPFNLPKQAVPTKYSFDFRQRPLEEWLKKLPLAHIGKTANMIFSVINESNGLILEDIDRLRVLENLYHVIHYINQSIIKHYRRFHFPLNQKNSNIAALSREFKSLMSIGYKIIIANQINNENFDKKILTTALHRSLLYLSWLSMEYYEIYMTPPAFIWREVNWIYQLSTIYNLNTQVVNSLMVLDNSSENIPYTIEEVYKQLILFTIVRPIEFNQLEISKVFYASGSWQKLCTIGNIDKNTNINKEANLFLIDLNSDMPPLSYSVDKNKIDNNVRLFDASKLDPLLEKLFNLSASTKFSIKNIQSDLNVSSLNRLIINLRKTNERAFTRYKTNNSESEIEIIFGLTAAHYIIYHNQKDYDIKLRQKPVEHIQSNLEKELGFTLFHRSRGGLTLTNEGRSMLVSIRKVLHYDEQVQQEAAKITGLMKGTVKVGTFTSVSSTWLPEIIKSMEQSYPYIRIELIEGDYEAITR